MIAVGRSSILTFLLLISVSSSAIAQETDRPSELPTPADTLQADSLRIPADPRRFSPDTLRVAPPPTAVQTQQGPALEQPVQFSAADSLVIEFSDEGDVGSLYGQAEVIYGEATLNAHHIDILFNIDELRAVGLPSDTGLVGRPRFSQGQEAFTGRELAFNLQTERGRVVGAQTSIQEGFIRAGVVKVDEDSTIYVAEGAYTTCECVEDPSYSLRSDKMKIVDQEWIYTGPIQLFLFNIPTPLWLPFGFLPAREGRRSGPLPPRYGEDERGFYLRDWGWYQAISDYMDAQVQFGLWTLGSWQVNPLFRYARRYHYRGQVGFDYVRNRSGERGDTLFNSVGTGRIRWNHSQELSPTSTINSNVDLSSSGYLRASSEQYEDRVRQTIQSSVGYSKHWRRAGRSLNLNLNHRQNLATRDVAVTLPNLRFTQNSRQPFSRGLTGGTERWYERIQYDYSGSLDNRYAFVPRPVDSSAANISWYEAMFSPSKYRRATQEDEPFEFKASHRIGTSASFTVNRIPIINKLVRLNMAPRLDYTEDWFIQTDRKRLADDSSRVITESRPDFLALRQFSTGVSANTTFYGLFPIRVGSFQGLRHTVRPSLSFTYRPDFYSDFWGYTDTVVNRDGEVERYALVNGVNSGKQQSLSFNVNNVFETKRVTADTTGDTRSQTIQLLNLDASTSYNFAAEQFKLAPINMSARTRIAEKFNFRMSSTLNPYALDSLGTRPIDRFVFRDHPFRPFRLTNFSFSLNTEFRSRQTGESRPFASPRAGPLGGPTGLSGDAGLDGSDPFGSPYFGPTGGYADFAIPWSIDLDFSYNYSKPFGESNTAATLNTGFDFNLTPNWKVQGRSGYDFKLKEIVYTSLSIFRDFECWEMAINWIPFGPYQSYSFDLHVKSGHLRDILRLRQPRSDVKGRFSGLLE